MDGGGVDNGREIQTKSREGSFMYKRWPLRYRTRQRDELKSSNTSQGDFIERDSCTHSPVWFEGSAPRVRLVREYMLSS